MNPIPTGTVQTSRGSIEIAPGASDSVQIRVFDVDSTLVASAAASGLILRDLCRGVISALQAGDLCFARGRTELIQLRVINGRYTSELNADALLYALTPIL